MGPKRTDEFRKGAVRIALTSGLTIAQQSKRSFDERGRTPVCIFHRTHVSRDGCESTRFACVP